MSLITESKATWNKNFGEGATFANKANAVISLGAGAIDIAQSAVNAAQNRDTSAEESLIKDAANTQFDYADYDSLQDSFSSYNFVKDNYTKQDIRNQGIGGDILSGLKTTASGFSSGASVGGPLGGIIGGAVGLGSSIIGSLVGNSKAQKTADALNESAKIANNTMLRGYANNAFNISTSTFNRSLQNMAAFGGQLDNYDRSNILEGSLDKKLPSIKPFTYNGISDKFAYGGDLDLMGDFSNGVTIIKNGGAHESNPYNGVQYGVDSEGVPNLVEEGEVIFNDYVFSNRLSPTEELLSSVGLSSKFKGKPFSAIAKTLQKESENSPNDPISINSLNNLFSKLAVAQETIKAEENKNNNTQEANTFGVGGWQERYNESLGTTFKIPTFEPKDLPKFDNTTQSKYSEYLKYLPLAISGAQVLSDAAGWTNKENYANADLLGRQRRAIRNVSYSPIGGYLSYTPYDTQYQTTQLTNSNLGLQRNLLNSALNRSQATTSLLAGDAKYQQQRGALYKDALDYNNQQQLRVADYNTKINQFNSQQALQANQSNASLDVQRAQLAAEEAKLRDQIESTYATARSANFKGFNDLLAAYINDMQTDTVVKDVYDTKNNRRYYEEPYATKTPRAKGGKINRMLKF